MDIKQESKLGKILAISGRPGLFRILSQAKNGMVVESLLDQKRFQTFAGDKVSSLEEVSIFTHDSDKPLKEVLKAIRAKAEGGPAPESKADNNTLTAYFNEVLPDYDPERVYISHIRKIFSWYNLLLEKGLLDLIDNEPGEAENESGATETAEKEEKNA
ncbi:MAG TPA: DUF5606 domain-containing protein [Bacteroidales bacterium]|nr:DUF5606 domain-containing protein [Bacteroidales bacterium]